MIDFLFKSSICLLTLLLFYHLVLEKEKMHHFNRFYLLLGIIISFVLPFITIEVMNATIAPIQQTYTYVAQENIKVSEIKESIDYKPIMLWSLYGLVSSVLLFRYIRNILKIVSSIKSNEIVEYNKAKLVLLEGQTPPHTFLNYIFLNKEDYQSRRLEKELYTHELIHVNQKHTLDILFIELVKTVFWFNPIFIFYKKAMQLNHEFLADEKVVTTYDNIPFYQNLLLAHINLNSSVVLTSNFNYSVTEKRFMMMTKNLSRTKVLLYKIALLPLFSGLVFFTCVQSIAQKNTSGNIINVALTPDLISDSYFITRRTTNQVINSRMKLFKEKFNTDVVFSDIKRNSKNEIITVKVDVSSPNKTKNTFVYSDNQPVDGFLIFAGKLKNKETVVGLYHGNSKNKKWKQTVYYDIPPPPPPIAKKSSDVALTPSSTTKQATHTNEKSTLINQPLIVIDGKKANPKITINDLNGDAIESVNVLKAINAKEEYGEDGKNGVVEISTKPGESSKIMKNRS